MSINTLIHAKDGEVILHIARRHWLALTPRLVLVFALVIGPLFFVFPLFALRPYGGFLFLALLLIGLIVAVKTAVQWYFTIFVVTSTRVVDVFQNGLFDRMVTDASYEVIQDVSYRKKGLLAMVFNLGTVSIQTAGSSKMLEVPSVAEPEVVLSLVNQARHDLKRGAPRGARAKLEQTLGALDEGQVAELVRTVATQKRKQAMDDWFSEAQEE